jgi:hypothetical protein
MRAFLKVTLSVFALLAWTAAAAADQSEHAQVLNQIINTAHELCAKPPSGGTDTKLDLSIRIDAALRGLARKLANVDAGASAGYQIEKNEGLLKGQVLPAIEDQDNCDVKVLSILSDALLKPIVQAEQSASNPQNAYLVATHPTNLNVTETKFMGWQEDGDEVYLNLRFSNSSELPAESVSFDILEWNPSVPFSKLKALKVSRSKVLAKSGAPNLTIAANSTLALPVVSISDLETAVYPELPKDFCVYDASLTPWDDVEELSAREKLPPDTDHNIEHATEKRFVLRLKYATIFGERKMLHQQIFLYYAKQPDEGLVWYPSIKKYDRFRCAEVAPWSITVTSPS